MELRLRSNGIPIADAFYARHFHLKVLNLNKLLFNKFFFSCFSLQLTIELFTIVKVWQTIVRGIIRARALFQGEGLDPVIQ